jgi:hypothetical protein
LRVSQPEMCFGDSIGDERWVCRSATHQRRVERVRRASGTYASALMSCSSAFGIGSVVSV